MRILSGIQPSGTLHLGNYFGMMKPAIELQDKGQAYYFIADYHSMTSLFDPAQRRENTLEVALDFLACGLDPARTVFFRQSDVPEVTELTWILGTVTPMGLLERCHSYKDKLAKGISFNFGLFAYPVLMAAANSSGGVAAKMISPQSIAVATAAVGLVGKESDLFRFAVKYSLIFALVVSIITTVQAYVLKFMIPKYEMVTNANGNAAATVDPTLGWWYLGVAFGLVLILFLVTSFRGATQRENALVQE